MLPSKSSYTKDLDTAALHIDIPPRHGKANPPTPGKVDERNRPRKMTFLCNRFYVMVVGQIISPTSGEVAKRNRQ
jgi:hypothetical protein